MYDIEDSNMMDNKIEELLTSSMSIRGLANKARNKALIKAYKQAKGTFGFEANIVNSNKFIKIYKYFHSTCGLDLDKRWEDGKLLYASTLNKLFKVEPHTYCFLSWAWDRKGGYPGYMYIFGKKSYKHFNHISTDILEEGPEHYGQSTTFYTIYASKNKGDWSGVRKINKARPFNTLYFDNEIEEKIKAHLDKWLKNKDTYKTRGIIFKTGILLYGSPGTGKSSIAAAVADYLHCNVISIDSASFKDLNINEVTASINADDNMYVVLLDDIDVILTTRDDENTTMDDKATIAKLLGFLDSSNSPDNVVFIATTNHIELFDSAISRAGRFDKVIEVENVSKSTAHRMCEGFGLSNEDAKVVIEEYDPHAKINPANLQVTILEKIKDNINNGK